MREEQSETTETATAEMVEDTTSCKRQGHPPRFRHTSSHLVRALKFTKSLSRRNKNQQHGGASAIDGIEVTLKDDSDSDAAEAAEKKEGKKSVTFAEEISEEIRVQEFEVDDDDDERTKKSRKMSRRHRHNSRMEHDEEDEADVSMYEERDDDQPFTILPCCKMSTAAADDDSVLLTPTYM